MCLNLNTNFKATFFLILHILFFRLVHKSMWRIRNHTFRQTQQPHIKPTAVSAILTSAKKMWYEKKKNYSWNWSLPLFLLVFIASVLRITYNDFINLALVCMWKWNVEVMLWELLSVENNWLWLQQVKEITVDNKWL